MPNYVIGILCSFATPILHGAANIFDGYLTNRVFRRVGTLIFASALMNIVFLPVVFFIDPPRMLSLPLVGIVLGIAVIEIAYQYPYLAALKRIDTSVVSSLFSLGRIFTPAIALCLVGENLTFFQYLGFFTLTLCGGLLTLDFKRLRLDRGLWEMLIVSTILSLQSGLYKYAFARGAGWGSVLAWSSIAELFFASVFLLTSRNIDDLDVSPGVIKAASPFLLLAHGFTWSGTVVGIYALTFMPLSVVQGIEGSQAIFVLLFAVMFKKTSTTLFKEELGRGRLWVKAALFLMLALGTWWISFGW
jgi:drug/metabolite transporter (DMT)-like permease